MTNSKTILPIHIELAEAMAFAIYVGSDETGQATAATWRTESADIRCRFRNIAITCLDQADQMNVVIQAVNGEKFRASLRELMTEPEHLSYHIPEHPEAARTELLGNIRGSVAVPGIPQPLPYTPLSSGYYNVTMKSGHKRTLEWKAGRWVNDRGQDVYNVASWEPLSGVEGNGSPPKPGCQVED